MIKTRQLDTVTRSAKHVTPTASNGNGSMKGHLGSVAAIMAAVVGALVVGTGRRICSCQLAPDGGDDLAAGGARLGI